MNLLCKVQVSATTKIINLFPIVVKPVPESSRGVNNSQFISFLRLTASSSQLSDWKVSLFIKYFLKREQFALKIKPVSQVGADFSCNPLLRFVGS